MEGKRPSAVGLLDRQMTIIEAIATSPDGLFLNEIADWAGLPKPTAHRMIAGMVSMGLLQTRGSGRKAYIVGPRLARLLYGGIEMDRLQRVVGPLLRELADDVRQTAYLARLRGMEVISVAMAAPERDWLNRVEPGHIFAPHATAVAKSIFAFQSAAVIDRILRPPLRQYSPFTITDPEAVRQEYAEVRRRGYAVCEQEMTMALVAYACPIALPGVGVLFGLGLNGPMEEMKRTPSATFVTALHAMADRIAAAIERLRLPNTMKAAG